MRDMTGEHATPWRFRATHASPPTNLGDLRRGEALPRPLSTRTAVVAGRRMRRPYEFRRSPYGEASPRPLSTRTAVVAGATHASPLRKPLLFVAARHASPSSDAPGGGRRATHASPLPELAST